MKKKEGENTFSSMKICLLQGNTSCLCSYFSLVVKGKAGTLIQDFSRGPSGITGKLPNEQAVTDNLKDTGFLRRNKFQETKH